MPASGGGFAVLDRRDPSGKEATMKSTVGFGRKAGEVGQPVDWTDSDVKDFLNLVAKMVDDLDADPTRLGSREGS